MLRHAYYKAYFPVDSGTPPLGLGPGGPTFVMENTLVDHKVASGESNFPSIIVRPGVMQSVET